MRTLTASLCVFLAAAAAMALTSADRVVPVTASWQTNPAALTLNWTTGGQAQAWIVQRKPLLTPGWTTLAVLTNTAVAYTDTTAVAGTAFEYRVTRQDAITNAWGYLYAGFNLPPLTDRGTLILVVESNTAAALEPELRRFSGDLAGDGWRTLRLTAPRLNWNDAGWAAAVTNLKAHILAAHAADPTVRAVLLFGRVPVPYSGDLAPDGHPEHVGAWPADAYYGDLDNAPWTDTITSPVNNGARLYNIPGDGKFDPSWDPEFSAELMVGRVDLADMPAFAQPEQELLRQYLAKNHQYRHVRTGTPPPRGLIRDNFGFNYGEAFAQTAIRDFGTWYGSSQAVAGAWFPTLRTNRYQAAYGCGSGQYTYAVDVGTTADFATGPVHTVFAMLFGSRFGDWDNTNNFLRAPLASTPSILTCAWAGRPTWWSHPMDLGEPIGRVFQLVQGNTYHDYESEEPSMGVQAALMGDPTLRLHLPEPPRQLSASVTGAQVILTWQPPPGSNWLYSVSRAPADSTAFSNLHAGLTGGLSYTGSLDALTAAVFQVRAARLESVRSGSYTNVSQGLFARVAADGHVNQPPVATNRVAATTIGQAVSIVLGGTDPDGDACFAALTAWPETGSLTGSPAALVYIPAAGFTGAVQFAYDASDGWADSSNATVSVTVAPAQTQRGTPCAWLIRAIGYAENYDDAEALDPDGDTVPTWAEYRAGTDPMRVESVFALLGLDVLTGSNRLTWYASTNSGVTSPMWIKKGTNWPESGWGWAASNLARHPSGTNTWADTNGGARAFYRVVIP
jgi:hypothetical protein